MLTGASGFIGRHVLKALEGYNVAITAMGRSPLNESDMPANARFVQMDMAQLPKDAFERLGRPELLIHLAWGGLPNYRDRHHLDVELPRQECFIGALVKRGLKEVFSVGTCFEYGMQEGALDEQMNPEPDNPYGEAKNALRQSLERLKARYPFALTWARLFYMWGAGQAENSLYPALMAAIDRGDKVFNMSGGEQLRDYLPVETVAELIAILALEHPNAGIVNLCSGSPVSVRALVERWRDERGSNIELNLGYYPYPDYEPMAFWGNRAKLDRLLAREYTGDLPH